MSEGKLKAKIDEFQSKGNISLSSGDVADFAAPESTGEDISGDVEVKEASEHKDTMLDVGEKGNVDKQVSDAAPEDNPLKLGAQTYTAVGDGKVIITEEEREIFLTAMIRDERFELPFEVYGGRVRGRLRSRTQSESKGILSRLSWEMNQGKEPMTNLEYTTRMRNMLLAAQVAELNDEEYTELKEPHLRTVDGDNVTEPGWLDQVDVWSSKGNEALTSAIYEQLRLFERKYWAMVASAKDQDFWHPAESTSE